jgi:D-alanine-D-alanine ligase
MTDALRQPKPKIVILYNENPDWPDSDKAWTARMVDMLSTALREEGYDHRPLKFFDSLTGLDNYDPAEWLIWNWAEEIGGQPWTDSVAAAELERRGFTYTGSRPEVLASSTDRMGVKRRLQSLGLPTLSAQLFSRPEQATEWKTFPAIVKGAHQHGSFGIEHDSVVHDVEQLASRVAYVREKYDDESLVEQFLDTREFHVGVLGNGEPEALPPAEYDYSAFTDMGDRLFTYQWKYDDTTQGYHQVEVRCPALPPDSAWARRLQELAIAAYQAFGLTDYGRVDMRMLGDEPQILDVNPNPDIDLISALMISARAHGLEYRQVIARIIRYATRRRARRGRGGRM